LYNEHRDSRKKLSKAYDWNTNILNWLGHEMTDKLKNQLSIKFE
jgi:hypothetical protein